MYTSRDLGLAPHLPFKAWALRLTKGLRMESWRSLWTETFSHNEEDEDNEDDNNTSSKNTRTAENGSIGKHF